MDDNCKELVQPVRISHIIGCIEQPELEREGNTVRELDVLLYVFLVLESLQMQREYVWEPLNLHPINRKKTCQSFCVGESKVGNHSPLLGLLIITTGVAEEFITLTKHLACAELTQAGSHARMLLNIDREVQEGLVPSGDLGSTHVNKPGSPGHQRSYARIRMSSSAFRS